MFVSSRFQHFVHMLWTMAKLDMVIKNYTLTWFATFLVQQQSQNVKMITKKSILAQFCEDSLDFQEKLHTIFLHAVSHVHLSLTEYLECSFLDHVSNTSHPLQNKFHEALQALRPNENSKENPTEPSAHPQTKRIRATTISSSSSFEAPAIPSSLLEA
jgi:hypothetical protein